MNLNNEPIRVAVVEDQADQRERLVQLLTNAEGLRLVACCSSAEDALVSLPDAMPDVVLMDIQLPGISGIECVRRLRSQMPSSQFMMLTVFEDHERIFQSLSAGAAGYLLKKTTEAKVLEAIAELHAGGAPMSGQIARQVISSFHTAPAAAPAEQLTPMEQEVLRQLARGLLYKEVALGLGVSVSTVRTHVWHIYQKLHAHNRTEAILKGLPRIPATRR
jgi:DNA-binding NarL/FixJ family response regulator